jgi:carbamoyl-phosphate synthase large subunit
MLPTLGGQTALNIAIALHETGVLDKYGVELIGADVEAIQRGEDRQRFKDIVRSVGGDVPASAVCRTLDEALAFATTVGNRIVVRPSFTMGGLGSGLAADVDAVRRAVARGLDASPVHEVLVEERPRLEGVRAGADARPQGQRGRGLLDREHRPDGCPHWRLGDRGAGHDADRPRVPADA